MDASTSVIIVGAISIDPEAGTVHVDGQLILLAEYEYKTLLLLARNAGRVVRKEEFWREVWGIEQGGTDDQIRGCIKRLRREIEPDPRSPSYLLTVRGRGYLLSE
jgi:two-component system response regulator RegX3